MPSLRFRLLPDELNTARGVNVIREASLLNLLIATTVEVKYYALIMILRRSASLPLHWHRRVHC